MTTSPTDPESASRTPAGQLHSRAIAVSHRVSQLLAAPSEGTELLTAIGNRLAGLPAVGRVRDAGVVSERAG